MASGEKRTPEQESGSDGKRPRLREPELDHASLIFGGGPTIPELPLRKLREVLAEPLPHFQMQIDTQTTPGRPGVVPKDVLYRPVGDLTKRIIAGLPNHEFRVAFSESEASVPIGSKAAGNRMLHNWIFDPINHILKQWPDPFVNTWRTELRHDVAGQPDWRCRIAYPWRGRVKAERDTMINLVGKRWPDFWGDEVPADVCRSGRLDLAAAYNDRTLSKDGRSAIHQCCHYLFVDGVDVAFLITPAVFWVIRCLNRREAVISISEPITANSLEPSMKQVAFAFIFAEIMAARERMENVPLPEWLVEAQKTILEKEDGFDNEHTSANGPEASDDGSVGDQLLSELEDTGSPVRGNSLVRFGRLRGVKVAAKIVSGSTQKWIIDENENEIKAFEALKSLQGAAVPEKVFAGKVSGGKDWLLITTYVEGDRFDKISVTSSVAEKARRALQEIHNQGFLYGDIMPRNIIVKQSEDCVFVDLGRSRQAENESQKETEMAKLEVLLP